MLSYLLAHVASTNLCYSPQNHEICPDGYVSFDIVEDWYKYIESGFDNVQILFFEDPKSPTFDLGITQYSSINFKSEDIIKIKLANFSAPNLDLCLTNIEAECDSSEINFITLSLNNSKLILPQVFRGIVKYLYTDFKSLVSLDKGKFIEVSVIKVGTLDTLPAGNYSIDLQIASSMYGFSISTACNAKVVAVPTGLALMNLDTQGEIIINFEFDGTFILNLEASGKDKTTTINKAALGRINYFEQATITADQGATVLIDQELYNKQTSLKSRGGSFKQLSSSFTGSFDRYNEAPFIYEVNDNAVIPFPVFSNDCSMTLKIPKEKSATFTDFVYETGNDFLNIDEGTAIAKNFVLSYADSFSICGTGFIRFDNVTIKNTKVIVENADLTGSIRLTNDNSKIVPKLTVSKSIRKNDRFTIIVDVNLDNIDKFFVNDNTTIIELPKDTDSSFIDVDFGGRAESINTKKIGNYSLIAMKVENKVIISKTKNDIELGNAFCITTEESPIGCPRKSIILPNMDNIISRISETEKSIRIAISEKTETSYTLDLDALQGYNIEFDISAYKKSTIKIIGFNHITSLILNKIVLNVDDKGSLTYLKASESTIDNQVSLSNADVILDSECSLEYEKMDYKSLELSFSDYDRMKFVAIEFSNGFIEFKSNDIIKVPIKNKPFFKMNAPNEIEMITKTDKPPSASFGGFRNSAKITVTGDWPVENDIDVNIGQDISFSANKVLPFIVRSSSSRSKINSYYSGNFEGSTIEAGYNAEVTFYDTHKLNELRVIGENAKITSKNAVETSALKVERLCSVLIEKVSATKAIVGPGARANGSLPSDVTLEFDSSAFPYVNGMMPENSNIVIRYEGEFDDSKLTEFVDLIKRPIPLVCYEGLNCKSWNVSFSSSDPRFDKDSSPLSASCVGECLSLSPKGVVPPQPTPKPTTEPTSIPPASPTKTKAPTGKPTASASPDPSESDTGAGQSGGSTNPVVVSAVSVAVTLVVVAVIAVAVWLIIKRRNNSISSQPLISNI